MSHAILKQNSLVEFLRSYGPLPSSNAQFDEHVAQTAERNQIKQIEVTAPRVEDLIQNWTSPSPVTIVLTGTAGDGKTYTCRRALEKLKVDMSTWGTSKIFECVIPDYARKLVIIKDLAELKEIEKRAVYKRFSASLTSESDEILVIAANDGHLVTFLRDFSEISPHGPLIDETIRTMLVDEVPHKTDLKLTMYNLSRQSHDKLFREVVDAIADHETWQNCEGCALLDAGCAIRRNLAVLADKSEPGLRSRLTQLIRLAAANDTHLPVRQLLLLCANIILGDSDTGDLIHCTDAHHLANDPRGAERLNPYRNVLGLNFDEKTRQQFRAFTVFDGVGLGKETRNGFDELLIEREPSDKYMAFVEADTHFGHVIFGPLQSIYRKTPAEIDMVDFHSALSDQRRRLFFVLPDDEGSNLNPWWLTIFTGGGEYLQFTDALANGAPSDRIKRRLLTGLNRVYSGLMTDDDDRLWLTGPAGYTQSRQGRVLDTAAAIKLGDSPQERLAVDFDACGKNGRPRLTLRCNGAVIDSMDITPILFEYLVRIQAGSLPSSFSRQCFEELRQFRLRSVASLAKHKLITADSREIIIVGLGPVGRLTVTTLPLGEA